MLLFGSGKRLSIDIDIVVSDRKVHLDTILDSICKTYRFTRFEETPRPTTFGIEKTHYKLYFFSVIEKKESYVMLDVVKEDILYQNIIRLPVDSLFVASNDAPVFVAVPDFNNLLADKLTAFAPTTTGIPYMIGDKEMGMEIIKQMYDIGCIVERADNASVILSVFLDIARKEIEYRDNKCSPEEVLDDIINHSLEICLRGNYGKADYAVLSKGMIQVKSFIFSEKFHLEKAITYAAKTAYIATVIKYEQKLIDKFDIKNIQEMKEWQIDGHLSNKLNKLKKSNPEAFFYLYRMSAIMASIWE